MRNPIRQGADWLICLRAKVEADWFMPAVMAVFIALRIAVLFVGPLPQGSDYGWYLARATEMAAGMDYQENGFITAFWPVGWPAFLAALFKLTGPSVLAGQLANLVLATLACLLTARLGEELFRDKMVGRLAALMLAIFPNQIGYVPELSTELFFECMLMLAVLLLVRERLPQAILAGLIFGYATLTKAQNLVLPGFVMGWIVLAAPGWAMFRRWIPLGLAMYVALILVVAPWTYRNWQVFGEFIPVSTNGGWTLLTGNNPEANGDYTPNTVLAEGLNHDPAQQIAIDKITRQRAMDWIKANPTRFVALIPKKFIRLWLPDGESEWSFQRDYAPYDRYHLIFRAVRVLNQAYYLLLMVLALPSIWLIWRGGARGLSPFVHTPIAVCAFFTVISLAFSGQSRFHLALMPLLLLYSAWTLARRARPAS